MGMGESGRSNDHSPSLGLDRCAPIEKLGLAAFVHGIQEIHEEQNTVEGLAVAPLRMNFRVPMMVASLIIR